MSWMQRMVMGFGAIVFALTIGYYLRLPWATSTWPWPVNPLDFILVSSFLGGASVVIFWIGWTGEWGAAVGATLNVGSMNAGAAVFLFQGFAREGDPRLLHRAIAFSLFALMNLGVLLWSARKPIRDRRPVDKLLHGSLAVFTIVLVIASVQLMRHSPTIFPWSLEPDISTMFGWLFLGSALYFLWATVRPSWHNARGQMLAFLAYDVVLIPPYLALYPSVSPEHLPSMRIYLAVIFYSSALAIYYLFINPRTRAWRIAESPARD